MAELKCSNCGCVVNENENTCKSCGSDIEKQIDKNDAKNTYSDAKIVNKKDDVKAETSSLETPNNSVKNTDGLVKHTLIVSKVFSTISGVLVLLMSLLCVILAVRYAGYTNEQTNFIVLVFVFSFLAFLFAVFGAYIIIKTYLKAKNKLES